MNTTHYGIHDIVNFSIDYRAGFLKKLLDTTGISFVNFRMPEKRYPLDFSIQIGSFSPKKQDLRILDDTYHIREGYLYFTGSRKLGKWEVEIDKLETNPTIRIQTNLAGSMTKPLTQQHTLPPLTWLPSPNWSVML